MKLTIPYPPSVNAYWRVVNGRAILSAEARAYKQGTKLRALTQGLRSPLAGPVTVSLAVYRPRAIGDLDNVLKATLDALKGIAFEDDKQVVEIFARRWDDKSNPRIEVNVEAATHGSAVDLTNTLSNRHTPPKLELPHREGLFHMPFESTPKDGDT